MTYVGLEFFNWNSIDPKKGKVLVFVVGSNFIQKSPYAT
jgi:hypothetical protein